MTENSLASEADQIAKCAAPPATLVNPASGLANDYLNLFNEIIMLIEQLPTMPDLIEDIFAWHPVTYQDYFKLSNLPERNEALAVYSALDSSFRANFEATVAELDHKATGAVAAIRRQFKTDGHMNEAQLTEMCARFGENLRKTLSKATSLVNYGTRRSRETAQHRADRLFTANLRKKAG